MRRPDYERIAETYDGLAVRRAIAADDGLGRAIARAGAAPLVVLDVGCGTGNWLAAQGAAFGAALALYGADPSRAMLARARGKVPAAILSRGCAERLPFAVACASWVVTRFTFHHFEDKPVALDELVRVLSPGGTLQVTNLAPEHMPGWWVPRWFPEAHAYTDARFWRAERLTEELERRGLRAELTVERRSELLAPADVLEQAARRDQSHLASLDDAAWRAGLARLRADLAAAPEAEVDSETAVLRVTASRP